MALEKWEFDLAHSSVGFVVRHMVISKVHGAFKRWSGRMQLDESNPSASSVEVNVQTGSVDTRDEKRDAHLRSGDFFDSDRYPEMVFKSTHVEGSGGHYRVKGKLTIRDVTREVVLDVEDQGRGKDPWGGTRSAFSAKTAIDRRDYGLMWNQALEAGAVLVSERVEIVLEVQATKSSAQQAA